MQRAKLAATAPKDDFAVNGGRDGGGLGSEYADTAAPANASAGDVPDAYDGAIRFSTENIDALTAASTAIGRIAESATRNWSALANEMFEVSAKATAAMCSAGSMLEAIQIHANFTRTAFERLVAEGVRVSEASMKATTEAFEPIQKRTAVALVTIAKPVEQLLTKSLRVVD